MGGDVGDIRVMGLVHPSHYLEDIDRDVPHNMTVTIPGALALRSKDLWRAVNQRQIYQLPSAGPPVPQAPSRNNVRQLENQVRELAERVRELESENQKLKNITTVQDPDTIQKLDEIIAVLKDRPMVVMPGQVPGIGQKQEEMVDGTAPMYLPDKIHPEDANVRIEVEGKSAPSDAVSAANRLRQIRKKGV